MVARSRNRFWVGLNDEVTSFNDINSIRDGDYYFAPDKAILYIRINGIWEPISGSGNISSCLCLDGGNASTILNCQN